MSVDGNDKVEDSTSSQPPKGKLASVTRKRNDIDKLLNDVPSNLNLIKAAYNEYLHRVEQLYEACGTQYDDWLLPHKTAIEMFRKKIVDIIHPGKSLIFGVTNEHLAHSTTSSTTSSVRLKLAEERAELASQKESLQKTMELESRELELKAQFDKEIMKINQERKQLEVKANEIRLGTLEKELDEIDRNEGFSNGSDDSVQSSRRETKESNNGLLKILESQNEISLAMTKCQQKSMLPKKEIRSFDGSDLTLFKTFLLNFERVIEVKCSDDCEKLGYLEQYTSGRAGELVRTCCHYDPAVGFAKAKELLIKEYGNEFKISNAYIEKLDNWPKIASEDMNALHELSIFLLNCHHYLENMSLRNQLQSPKELWNIVQKLPYMMRDRWRRKTHNVIGKNESVTFKHLVDFVQEETSVLKQPLFGNICDDNKKSLNPTKKSFSTEVSIANYSESSDGKVSRYCQYCKKDNHFITSCTFFKNLPAEEKSSFVKKARLCFGCLHKDHMSNNCTNRNTCDVCGRSHPTVLHFPSGFDSSSHVIKTNEPEDDSFTDDP